MAITDRGFASFDVNERRYLCSQPERDKASLIGPMALEALEPVQGEYTHAIVNGVGDTIKFVSQRHEDAARELVRLVNLSLDTQVDSSREA